MKKITISVLISIVSAVALSAGETNALLKALTSGNGGYIAKTNLETFQRENQGDKMSLINENCPAAFGKCSKALLGGLANKNAEIRRTIVSELATFLGDSYYRGMIAENHAAAIGAVCAKLTKMKDKDAGVTEVLNSVKDTCKPAVPELLFGGKAANLAAMKADQFERTKGESVSRALNPESKNMVKNAVVILNTITSPKVDAAVRNSLLTDLESFVNSASQSGGPLADAKNKSRSMLKKSLEGASKKVKDADAKKRLAALAAVLK